MDARQKRLFRKEQAKKRKRLMYEQDTIETMRCKGCKERKREYTDDRHNYKTTAAQECGHCPYFKRLNEIGGELLNLSHQKTQGERENTIMANNKEAQLSNNVQYERSDLTTERYLNHKKLDEYKDDKIRELYGNYPKSSFDKWKKDNNLVTPYKKDVKTKDATPAPKSEQSDTQLQRKHDKLKLEYDSLKTRYDETAERCCQLEKELVIEQETSAKHLELSKAFEEELKLEKETNQSRSELLKLYEADIAKLEQELQELQAHKEVCKSESNETPGECATCQELAKLLQQRDEQDEEVADAFNKQMDRFDQYEDDLFDRIKQLKRELRELRSKTK